MGGGTEEKCSWNNIRREVISGLQNLQSAARISLASKVVKEAVVFALCVLQLFNVML